MADGGKGNAEMDHPTIMLEECKSAFKTIEARLNEGATIFALGKASTERMEHTMEEILHILKGNGRPGLTTEIAVMKQEVVDNKNAISHLHK